MPIRQILVCSSLFILITCGAAFLEHNVPPTMPAKQLHLHSRQPNARMEINGSFQPREYIRIVQLRSFEVKPMNLDK